MSFWPFGQNFNSSNINGILEEYFHVMHGLENQSQEKSTGGEAGVNIMASHDDTISRDSKTREDSVADISRSKSSSPEETLEDEQRVNKKEGGEGYIEEDRAQNEEEESNGFYQPSLIPAPRYSKSRIDNEVGTPLKSASSHPNSLSTNSASSNSNGIEKEPISMKSLNHKFMDDILEETELLNELTRQNNTLLDFVCFGYFYSESGEKVENIEYLIDQLMACIDRIDDDDDVSKKDNIDDEDDDHDTNNNVNDNNDDIDDPKKSLYDNDDENAIFGNEKNGVSGHSFSTPPHDDSIIPMIDSKVKKRSTYLNKANIISEIFALDIWLISESLVKNPDYLNKIWSILYHEKFTEEKSPLIPIFLKINQNLLLTRQDQYLNFIRSRELLVKDMLKHVDISLLMDFFLKIIATDKQEAPTGTIELVYEQNIISELFTFLDNSKYDADIQACAGDFIKSIIAISANAPLDEMSIGPNALTREIASEKCIDYLLGCITEQRGPALMTAVSITIELIRKNNSDYDQVNLLTTTIKSHPPSMRDPVYLGVMLRRFSENLINLKKILSDVAEDDSRPMVENQLGELYKPLGFERFKVVELIAELLHCSNMGLMNSKKAERIVKERDQIRTELVQQLEDALTDLNIKQRNSTESSTSVTPNQCTLLDDDEVDESFEVPYVNDEQNEKLRRNPTVGDLFKIELYDSQLLPVIIQLFIQYPWNNFWHNVIFDIIQQIFNGRMDFSYNSFLVFALFSNKNAPRFATDGGLLGETIDFQITTDLVLQGYKNSHAFYEHHNTSLGFMGHLVLIAEEIVKFSKVYKVDLISPDIHEVLLEEEWEFYSNDILNDTRVMYSKILGGGDYIEDGNLAGDIVMGNDQDPTSFSTQMDLHEKLREKIIEKSRVEIDNKNEKNGVIILPAT